MAETATATRAMTAEEFLALPDDGRRRELVRGEMVEMAGSGLLHTVLTMRLASRLAVYTEVNGLGFVGGADAGCWLDRDPDTVRIPDAAFWSLDSLGEHGLTSGFAEVPPDLVVEVVSPTDRGGPVHRKTAMWLEAGVPVVWIVWPDSRAVHVHRADADPLILSGDGVLTCEDLLPGFAFPIEQLFAGLPADEAS